jgi:hypothetical protein
VDDEDDDHQEGQMSQKMIKILKKICTVQLEKKKINDLNEMM